MTNITAAAPFAEGDFRVGRVLSRTAEVLSRNFLTFFIVTTVAALPSVLLNQAVERESMNPAFIVLAAFLTVALSMLSTAVVVYGAFQAMRGRPVNLGESLRIGLGRVIPILGVIICASIGVGLASLLLVIPGLILLTMWFVATPVCVVEQLGPMSSLGRSSALTKGHRWKIFGMVLLVILAATIVTAIIGAVLAITGSTILIALARLIWSGVWGAFYAIFVVVTYHDLRVAKEGVDVHQIAAVFD